jgi:tetratricopeptide (TPR) repeat protein
MDPEKRLTDLFEKGLNYVQVKEYDAAVQCGVEALMICEENGITGLVQGRVLFNLARTYLMIRKPQLALPCLCKVKELLSDPDPLMKIAYEVGTLGLLSHCYFLLDRYDEALLTIKELFSITSVPSPPDTTIMDALTIKYTILVTRKVYSKAIRVAKIVICHYDKAPADYFRFLY